jgi:hypothetical protein
MYFRYLLTIITWPTIDIKVTLFQCQLLRDITVARTFWLSQSEERKNLSQPQNWPSLSRNVSLVNGQTDRLASPCGTIYFNGGPAKKLVSLFDMWHQRYFQSLTWIFWYRIDHLGWFNQPAQEFFGFNNVLLITWGSKHYNQNRWTTQ